ncbi:MAG TPA: electron transfer flavoprotein subunit alpha/FixB family protein [Paludibaculum sp.]|jgi:electron transfer flavoprotein alpha subunit
MSCILVVTEQTGGVWHKMSFETLAAGQQMGLALGLPVTACVFGTGLAGELSGYELSSVIALDSPFLAEYTADAATAALVELIAALAPAYVLFPHTYQVRDYAPKVATRCGRALISDAIGYRVVDGAPVFQRQVFQGKLTADVAPATAGPVFVSFQAGAFRAEALAAGVAGVEVRAVALDAAQIRQRPEAPFRESARAVDLSAAELIVAVGRGIKEEGNVALAQELAEAMGAELAASRPICDNGWLPMERQVGSSGQTVAPKVYVALGISGAIQHQVGMKGSKCVVAINKDPNAPIFEIADYGIVGDLFDVVPALTAALKAR